MKFHYIHNIFHFKSVQCLAMSLVALALFIAIPQDGIAATMRDNNSREVKVDTAVFMREAKELQELIVRPQKEKYTKRNNPAVMLMERVREYQSNGDPTIKENYSFDQYDKTTMGLLDFSEKELNKHSFLKDYVDTTRYGHRPVLYVLLKEKNSTQLYAEKGAKHKTVVRGRTSSGIDEAINDGNVSTMLEEVFRDVDIYGNDITIMANRFVSPLSRIGADYYKYFITDTVDVDGVRCIQLTFSPRNPESFSFMGNLYVEVGDTTGFVKKVSMKVPRVINLNYVDNLYIDQTFEKDSLGKRHKVLDEMNLDLCLIPGTQSIYTRRVTRYSNFSYDRREDLAKAYDMLGDVCEIEDFSNHVTNYGVINRLESLSKAEANMDTFMTHLRGVPFFYWAEKVLAILVNGYLKTGNPSKFDIGPVNTLISGNSIEGVRFRVGGMTTANLSPYWFARGYVAYGTRDHRWKYKGELEYSFYKKKYHSREFPVNSIRATYMYDLDMLGQHYLFTNPDNVFLTWKRRPSNLGTYRQLSKIEYNLELANQLSFSVWGERVGQHATRWLPFTDGSGRSFGEYTRTSFGVKVRYAPGEKYVQEKSTRVPINMDAPVVQITHEWGPSGLLGSDFTTNRTELSVQKRFWFSAFGYTDIILKGGIIWSQVQYPELMWPNANLSYTIQPESYSLMNPMEFALDKYASWDLTYWGNGVLFNRIPVVKKAKLREVIGFKGIYGGISNRNKPELHDNLFLFPADSNTRYMGRSPYMEISAGIDNIFTILRVDYIWRLSYRDTPSADRSGVRVALHFTF